MADTTQQSQRKTQQVKTWGGKWWQAVFKLQTKTIEGHRVDGEGCSCWTLAVKGQHMKKWLFFVS